MIIKNMKIEKEIKMKPRKLVFYLLAVVLGGCLPSLHQLYTDETLIFEEKLIGKWLDGNTIWEFKKEGEKAYDMRVFDGKEGLFKAHLVKLGDMLFLDVFPDDATLKGMQDLYKIHLIPAHTFMKVDEFDPNLVLRMMDPEDVSKLLENDPDLLKHERVDDGIVLTASTEQLQEFMLRYANDEGIFGDASEMTRLEPLYTEQDVIFDVNLVGQWEGKNGEILDSIQMPEKTYDIIFTDGDDTEYRVCANLVKTKDMMFLGIFFNKSWLEDKGSNGSHLIPDLFMKVDQIEPKLLLREIKYQELVELLKNGPEPPEQESQKVDYAFEGFRVQL